MTIDKPVNPADGAGHCALRRGRVSLPGQIYNVTAVTRDRFPYFRNFRAACIASRCFEDRSLLGDVNMLAWVLMHDHVHWLLQLGESDVLATMVNRLKSASARKANAALGRSGQLWAAAFHDHALRAEEDVAAVARYIIANPVRAAIVRREGDYPFWNAVWMI
jgi:putative transposase